jgi:hypothetical protein
MSLPPKPARDAPVSDYFKEARKHHNAQRFTQAETLYRRVVDAEPTHVGA